MRRSDRKGMDYSMKGWRSMKTREMVLTLVQSRVSPAFSSESFHSSSISHADIAIACSSFIDTRYQSPRVALKFLYQVVVEIFYRKYPG